MRRRLRAFSYWSRTTHVPLLHLLVTAAVLSGWFGVCLVYMAWRLG